jgi:hypothetical protein
MFIRRVAAPEDRGPGPAGGAEKDARAMLPSSPSLRSIDRSFLLRAASPCRLPIFSRRHVAPGDGLASKNGVRIASSASVRFTQDACASNLSNGFASDPCDPSQEACDALPETRDA